MNFCKAVIKQCILWNVKALLKSTWNIRDLTDLILNFIKKCEVNIESRSGCLREVHPNTSHILVIHRRPESKN